MTPAVFADAAEGIAREAALLARGRPAVLLWTATAPALVVPQAWARRDGVRALEERAALAGWPILARRSGGGATPQGPFTLNLAMIAPLDADVRIEDGYDLICGALAEALSRFDVASGTGPVAGAFCDGAWNVTADGRKLAGTAQRWRTTPDGGRVALCHAAILLEPPPPTVWPALDALHRSAGLRDGPDPSAHVSLQELMPKTMRAASFAGALARAAENRLSCAPPPRRRVAQA